MFKINKLCVMLKNYVLKININKYKVIETTKIINKINV